MKFEDAYGRIEKIEGWMGFNDCQILFNYAKKIKNGLIVEIGSFKGRSTKLMALASPTSTIVAIDPASEESWFEEVNRERLRNVEFIKEKSQVVGKTWDREIDLLHVDGDHHYKAVAEDIRLFIPFVKEKGHVLFHDYAVFGEPGIEVREAVKDLNECFKVIREKEGFACCEVKKDKRPSSYQYLGILKEHLGDLTKIERGGIVYPRQIEVHLPGDHKRACNFDCYYCQGKLLERDLDSGWEMKALNLMRKLKHEIPYYIFGGAYSEPLMNPYFMTFLAATKEYGASFGIHTNGSLLKRLEDGQGFLTELCRLGTNRQDYLSISLDAGFEESHTRTKGLKRPWFDEILEGIKMVAEMDRKLTVRICYLLNNFNCTSKEIEKIVNFAKEVKVDSLRFSIPYARYGQNFKIVKEYKKQVEENWGRKIEGKLIPFLNESEPCIFYLPPEMQDVEEMNFRRCIYSFYQITLGADGYVYRCSSAATPSFKRHRLGKITDNLEEFNKMVETNHKPDWDPCQMCWPRGARCNRMALEINKWYKRRS
ncbi:MAG: class I SAM-dependent methyltransferase [Candidatus Hodarchaeota archaeon]